jgi:hypothetical protein
MLAEAVGAVLALRGGARRGGGGLLRPVDTVAVAVAVIVPGTGHAGLRWRS